MSIHTISNTNISISVNSYGAELISLKSKETELIWQADKAVWPRYAPVLFPIVGKLNDKRNNSLTQHGFARDKEFVLVEQTEKSLEFELCANEETLTVYPFHFSLRIRYELDANSINIKYIVFNPNGNEMFFSMGAHPGFNCKRITDESLEDFYLDFENENELMAEKLSDGLLSGESYTIKLIENKLPLSTSLFDNDALVFKNKQIEKLKLCSSKSKIEITIDCKDWPYFGIWSKKGSDAFVCLEPWYGITDSMNSGGDISTKEGMQLLKAYCSFEVDFNIRLRD